jgi:hypothetical protein
MASRQPIGNAALRPALEALLESDSVDVRAAALAALIGLEDEAIDKVGLLAARLDDDPPACEYAAEAIGTVVIPADRRRFVAASMANMLESDLTDETRHNVVMSLLNLHLNADAVPAVVVEKIEAQVDHASDQVATIAQFAMQVLASKKRL